MKKVFGRIVVMFLGLFIALFIGECFARLKYQPAFIYPPLIVDEILGHRLLPDTTVVQAAPEFNVKITTNSYGYRDSEFSGKRIPGKRRLMVLGDSFMFGSGVKQDKIFPALIEKRYEADKEPVEVYNMGVKAYGPDQYLMNYEQSGRQFKPDVVLISLLQYNDIENMTQGIGKPRYTLEDGKLVFHASYIPQRPAHLGPYVPTRFVRFKKWLAQRSSLYQYVKASVRWNFIDFGMMLCKVGIVTTPPFAFLTKYDPMYVDFEKQPEHKKVTEAYAILTEVLRTFKKYSKEDGFKLMVMVVPTKDVVYKEAWDFMEEKMHAYVNADAQYDRDTCRRRLLPILDKLEIPYIDTTDLQRAQADKEEEMKQFYVFDGHWTDYGTKTVADIVYPWLKKEWPAK